MATTQYPGPAALSQLNVKDFGATGNGVTDDRDAIQATINLAAVAGNTVFFPAGTYLCNTSLVPANKVNYLGVGQASIIKVNGTNNMFDVPAGHAKQWWLRALQLQATGGHILNGTAGGVYEVLIEDSYLRVYTSTKAIINITALCDTFVIRNCDLYAAGAIRTIAAVNVQLSSGASNWIDNIYGTYGDFCTNQPFILFESQVNAGNSTGNRFTTNNFGGCDGGSLKLLSLFGTTVDGCWCNDNSATPGLSASVVYCGKSAATGAVVMAKTVLRDVGRDKNPASGVQEIVLESTCVQTVIENPRWVPDTGTINCNSTDVLILGASPGTTIVGGTNTLNIKGAASLTVPAVVTGAVTATSEAIIPGTGGDSTTALRVTTANAGAEVFDVDTINKRVGIGTTAPSQALEVATGNVYINAPGTGYVFVSRGANTNNAGFLFATGGSANLKWLIGTTNGNETMHVQDQISGVDVLTMPNNSGRVGVGNIVPTSVLHVNGPVSTVYAAKTAAYTITATDSTITGNATTAIFTVTLPTAAGITGRQYTIKKTDASANAITLATTSSQTIDGTTTKALSVQYAAFTVQSDGANWQIIGKV